MEKSSKKSTRSRRKKAEEQNEDRNYKQKTEFGTERTKNYNTKKQGNNQEKSSVSTVMRKRKAEKAERTGKTGQHSDRVKLENCNGIEGKTINKKEKVIHGYRKGQKIKTELIWSDHQKKQTEVDTVEIMSCSSDESTDDSDFEPEAKTLRLTSKSQSSSNTKIVEKSGNGTKNSKSKDKVDNSKMKKNGDKPKTSESLKQKCVTKKESNRCRSGKPHEKRSRNTCKQQESSGKSTSKRKQSNKKDEKLVKQDSCKSVEADKKEDMKKQTTNLLHSNIDQSDVMSVLLHMEGQSVLSNSKNDWPRQSTSKVLGKDVDVAEVDNIDDDTEVDDKDDESEDEEDWEEVEDDPSQCSPLKSQIPSEPVEVTLDAPLFMRKRKKKQFDWKAYIQKQINKYKKDLREDIHKVHLMCLLARGIYLNRVCNDVTLHAVAMSIIPTEFINISLTSCTTSMVERLMKWYKSTISIDHKLEQTEKCLVSRLMARLDSRSVASLLEFILLFIIVLRYLGFQARLVMSIQPLSLKSSESKKASSGPSVSKIKGNPAAIKKKSKIGKENSDEKSSTKNRKERSHNTNKIEKDHEDQCTGSGVSRNSKQKTNIKNKQLRHRGSKVKPGNYKEDDGSDDEEDEFVPSNNSDEEDKEESRGNKRRRKGKGKKTIANKKQKISRSNDSSHIDEEDFEEVAMNFRSPLKKSKLEKKANRKILSSDSENDAEESQVCDQWAEVYIEEKWICVDCMHAQLNRPYRIESAASQPVHYVIAYNPDGTVKDVTARYASKWMTETRKFRVDYDWWDETMEPFKSTNQEFEEQEDSDIKSNLVSRPMPTSIAAFKSHPLYALKRHLLKFEAIYPESSIPLGYIRGEPVYARECVHELHSRENWLKEGRAVRIGEKPYKMVKSRAKWKKPKENPDALDLEVFGLWQTEEYIPPPAVDGKVPRNDYGNIELFKPSMLPAGTVYLKVQGLNKVAKKLNLDCVPAMVGWDSHCGFSHPVLEGFVVCEEHKDILLAAWDEEQEIQKQKEAEKKEKRATNNWKVLIKGLLIRERLKKRFDLEEKVNGGEKEEEEKSEKGQRANDAELSWPRRQQDAKDKKVKGKKTGIKSDYFKVETM